jgi:hypothetical protein
MPHLPKKYDQKAVAMHDKDAKTIHEKTEDVEALRERLKNEK